MAILPKIQHGYNHHPEIQEIEALSYGKRDYLQGFGCQSPYVLGPRGEHSKDSCNHAFGSYS